MQAEPAAKPALFSFVFALAMVAAVAYFAYAAIQGDYGTFRGIQVTAQSAKLETELASLRAERAELQNLTRRMSVQYLDLDLLDERARQVLGLARGDEIIIR